MLHLSIVANEKGAVGLSSAMVANFTYFILNIAEIFLGHIGNHDKMD